MADRIQFRRDTAEQWSKVNPVLLEGEIGVLLDNPNRYKMGDGKSAWNSLPWRGFNGNIVQEEGDDENAVMSQKAFTVSMSNLRNRTDKSEANAAEAASSAQSAKESAQSAKESAQSAKESAQSAKESAQSALSNSLDSVTMANDAKIMAGEAVDISTSNRFGYNASVYGLKGGTHTLESAIKDVPAIYRSLGQKITFRGVDGWKTYQNKSLFLADYEKTSEWEQEVGVNSVTGDVNIENNPDYEDLTETADGTLKFADKEYSKDSFSGLGRVYLRKNIVDGVNVMTQDMMSKPNIIYIIQYDYDLQGAGITIPEGCILDFKGGSLNNGMLAMTDTELKGTISFVNIEASGRVKNYELYESWFGFDSYSSIDLSNHKLTFDRDIEVEGSITIDYDLTNTIVDGNKKTVKHNGGDFISLSKSVDNLTICNFVYKGNKNSTFFGQPSSYDVERKYIEVCHNFIHTCNLGISLNSDIAGVTNHCSIHDNYIDVNNDSVDIGSYGIHLANANYTKVYNNIIKGNKRHALYNAWGHHNDIFNNKFIDNWITDAEIPGPRGILFVARGSNNINIYNNYFENGRNVDIHIYKGAYEDRRSESPMYNINVYNNKFNVKKEKKSAIAKILVGYNSLTDEYNESIEEKFINIYNNSFYGDIPHNVVTVHSGKNIHVYGNNIYQKSDISDLVFVFSLSPYTTDRIENITIETNTVTIENNNKACVYFIDNKFNEFAQRTDVIIRNNNYNKQRLKDGLGYKFSYNAINRTIFQNVETEYRIYDIYDKSVDEVVYPDEYHLVNDVIRLHKFNKDGTTAPVGTLQCVSAGNPGVWYKFDYEKFDQIPYGTAIPTINYIGKKYILNRDFKYVDMENVWRDYDGEPINISRAGSSANRPTNVRKIGFMYIDQTIGKPIWWTGSKWVDASGIEV